MALDEESIFSAMDIDTIGEILNISMGTAATTLSEMLEQKVNITTPRVQVLHSSKIEIKDYEPAVGVEINYVSGLKGKNVMVLKESDIKIMVKLLMHSDDPAQDFPLDEMSLGAVCEVMNQMMGSSSTALSQFLNRPINISPPNSFPINSGEDFKNKYFEGEGNAVIVTFHLAIGDVINSDFICLMTVDLAKELVSAFHFTTEDDDEPAAVAAAQPSAPERPRERTADEQKPKQIPTPPKQQAPKVVPNESYTISQASYPSFDEDEEILTNEQNNNLSMIMSVSLQITVEIGRTTKKIKDILDFTTGTIVELNKAAGSQVDVFVNGKPIAKGDVVVVDDYYGVRITEILSNNEIMKLV